MAKETDPKVNTYGWEFHTNGWEFHTNGAKPMVPDMESKVAGLTLHATLHTRLVRKGKPEINT